MELCKDGMFWCAFELVLGIGAGVAVFIFILWVLSVFAEHCRASFGLFNGLHLQLVGRVSIGL